MLEVEPPPVLVVDDDARLRALLERYLSDNGFRVSTAESAAQARLCLRADKYAAMVLDIMMPGETGLELAADLRAQGAALPIMMLTARGESEERIEGLEAGADDYLAKPFEPRELVLRLQKLVARGRSSSAQETRRVVFGPYTYAFAGQRLTRNGEQVHLTSGETHLLEALADAAGVVLSREALSEKLNVPASERTIDVQITRLRKKIERDPRQPVYIQTIRHQGYVLRAE